MSASKWEQLVRQCVLRRTHGDEFRELAEFMSEKYQTSGRGLIKHIVECRQSFSISSDPLIPQYIRAAATSGLSQTSDVLHVLIQNWNSNIPGRGLSAEAKKPGCLSSPDSIIVNDLALIIASSKTPHNSSEIRKSLSFTSRWLTALIGWISDDGENRSYLAVLTLLEALGILFASIASTEQGMLLLGNQEETGKRRTHQTGPFRLGQAHAFLGRSQSSGGESFGNSTSTSDQHIGAASYPSRHDSEAFQPLPY
jgi:hypothetical protein